MLVHLPIVLDEQADLGGARLDVRIAAAEADIGREGEGEIVARVRRAAIVADELELRDWRSGPMPPTR